MTEQASPLLLASRALRDDLLGAFHALEKTGWNQILSSRCVTLAGDLAIAAELLDDAMHAAHDEFAAARPLDPRPLMYGAGTRATVLLKAFYFFVRASQDELGRLLAWGLDPKRTNLPSQTMASHLKPRKASSPPDAVAELIDRHMPSYRAWFSHMRDVRDRIKGGDRSLALIMSGEGVASFELHAFTPDGDSRTTVIETLTPADISRSVVQTRDLLAVAVALAAGTINSDTGGRTGGQTPEGLSAGQ